MHLSFFQTCIDPLLSINMQKDNKILHKFISWSQISTLFLVFFPKNGSINAFIQRQSDDKPFDGIHSWQHTKFSISQQCPISVLQPSVQPWLQLPQCHQPYKMPLLANGPAHLQDIIRYFKNLHANRKLYKKEKLKHPIAYKSVGNVHFPIRKLLKH